MASAGTGPGAAGTDTAEAGTDTVMLIPSERPTVCTRPHRSPPAAELQAAGATAAGTRTADGAGMACTGWADTAVRFSPRPPADCRRNRLTRRRPVRRLHGLPPRVGVHAVRRVGVWRRVRRVRRCAHTGPARPPQTALTPGAAAPQDTEEGGAMAGEAALARRCPRDGALSVCVASL